MKPLRVWVYGRGPGVDVVVDAPDVADRHCLIAQYADGFALEDLASPAGTWVNGERLSAREPRWVTAADTIRMGTSAALPWPVPSASANPARIITIGRAPDNNVVLDYPMVSWQHARLSQESTGELVLEDLGSTNGTFLNAPDNRISRAAVTPGDHVFFGTLNVRASRLLDPGLVLGDASQGQIRLTGQQMVLGRDPEADCPLPYPMISWRHARLERTARGIEVEDLGSRNGTFVDGVRIHGRVLLRPGSDIALGSFRFRLLDDQGTLDKRAYADNVTISAVAVTVEVGRGSARQQLLQPVSLTILPGELVALMGLAGAGKTTLLKALNGYTPPTTGRVLFNGDDLYENQEQFRTQIGYVPQDDILHADLTVREALRYTARLRTDLRADEIEARVTRVLTDLGIEDIGDRLIGSPERKVISGGQRKRVSIAMELLSDPSVLFLDEPTSGLSSYDALQVVQLLRRLADRGKTIICTIHQPSTDIFKEFDALLLVGRDKGNHPGRLVYFGPAYPASIDFFSPHPRAGAAGSPEDVMTGLAGRPASEWAQTYERSTLHDAYIVRRAVGAPDERVRQPRRRTRAAFRLGQFPTLASRTLRLKLRDRVQMAILLAQAPLFAGLVSIVFFGLVDRHFDDPAEWAEFAGKLASVHFLMVVAAVWFGCNNAARDIVGETTVLQRERMVNLGLPSYVASKIAVLALFCLVQCTALLAIVYYFCDLEGPVATLWTVLVAASLTGTALGLLISAMSRTTEAAIAFLPVVLLPFILLGGGIKPVHEMPDLAQSIAAITPTRWAYEGNLLLEARERSSTFTNALEQKLIECQQTVAACQPGRQPRPTAGGSQSPRAVATERDVAAGVFPPAAGRSSLRFTFQTLATQFAVSIILVLAALSMRFQR